MAWKKIQWSDDGGSVVVRKNSGSNIGTRPRLNFIEGSNVTLAISDDAGSDEVDISIAATQYSHPSAPPCRSATSGQTGHATAAQIGKLNGIDTGADVTGSNPPQAHGASVHTDRTRTFLVCPHHYTNGDVTDTGVALDPSTVQKVAYRFALPKDFVSLSSVKVLWTADSYDTTNKNIVLDVNVKFGTPPQSYSAHNNNDSDNIISIASYSFLSQWLFTITSSAFTSIAQGDVVLVTVERDADHGSDTFTKDIIILGVLVEYTADM